jgi:hypothetical protein
LRAATNGYNGNIDDGLLLDSYPPIRAGPGRTPEQFHEDCLRAFARAWADGSLTGLALAIRHCQRCGRLLPDWAATVILQLLGKPGRLARLAKADRWNRIHYTRWDMVRDLQDRWQEPRLAEKYLSNGQPPMPMFPKSSPAPRPRASPTRSRRATGWSRLCSG